MARKRKRAQASTQDAVAEPRKRTRIHVERGVVKHPTLGLYYAQISSLRDYLLSKLPTNAKTRRRRVGSAADEFLDSTLVCMVDVEQPNSESTRSTDYETFSQQLNLTAGSSIGEGCISQSDLVDFAIWLLFHKIHRQAHRPPHMLCQGYQRANNPRRVNQDHCASAGVPGLVSHYPNGNVDALKEGAWIEILSLLGKEGDRIMLDLILGSGIFLAVDGGRGNFYQLSGMSRYAFRQVGLTYRFQVLQ